MPVPIGGVIENGGRINPAIRDLAAVNQVQDQAAWDAVADPAAKLEALRQAVIALIARTDQDNDALLPLLKTFVTDGGGQTVLRRNLVVANGVDIVIQS